MSAEVLFPARQKCKACGKKLGADGAPVPRGLFCSYRCAAMAEPSADPSPEKTPRECRTERGGRWVFKRRYRSVGEIPDRLRNDPSTSWYECSNCGCLHIGHTRMGEAESFRMTPGVGDIADILVKRRGTATREQVAAAAGVRPVRLKELEEGVAHPEGMATLLKIAPVLRLRVGLAIEPMPSR